MISSLSMLSVRFLLDRSCSLPTDDVSVDNRDDRLAAGLFVESRFDELLKEVRVPL